jgi:transposase-like protein
MGRTRRTFSAQQKSQIALEAIRERKTLSEIAQQHDVHPTQINVWKKQVTEGISTLFEQAHKTQADDTEAKIALLYQQIGQLQFELDWLKKKHKTMT